MRPARPTRRPKSIAVALDRAPFDCRATKLLRATCHRYDLSYRHLARSLECSTVTAQRLLDGTAEPRASHMFRCRAIYRIPLDAWKTDRVKNEEKRRAA